MSTDSIKIHQSVTGFADTHLSPYFHTSDADSTGRTVVKLAAGSVAFPVLTLAGAVESLVRNALVLIVKCFQFFIPKQYAEMFNQKFFHALIIHAEMTTNHTVSLATKIVTNFFGNKKREETSSTIEKKLRGFYGSETMKDFYNIHINGFNAKPLTKFSIVGYMGNYFSPYLTTDSEDGILKRGAKYAAGAVAFAFFAAIGVIETTARHAFMALAKAFQFFIPAGYTQSVDANVLHPALKMAEISLADTINVALQILTNLMSPITRLSVRKDVHDGMKSIYHNKYVDGMRDLHINGFS